MDRVQINARWDRQARELRISKARAKGPAFGHCGETTAWLTASPARTKKRNMNKRKIKIKRKSRSGEGRYKDRGIRFCHRHADGGSGQPRRLCRLAWLSPVRFAGKFCVA